MNSNQPFNCSGNIKQEVMEIGRRELDHWEYKIIYS